MTALIPGRPRGTALVSLVLSGRNEALWDGEVAPIKTPINPECCDCDGEVTAPVYDGRYILTWDLPTGRSGHDVGDLAGRGFAGDGGHGTGGKLVFADLAKLFDTAATSPDTNRESGNFDGSGLSFPASSCLRMWG